MKRTLDAAMRELRAEQRRSIVSAGSADAENLKLLRTGRQLRHAPAAIDMKLHEFFKIDFSISTKPDQHHKLCAVLRHFIECVLSGPPEAVRCSREASHIGRKTKVANTRGRGIFNHRADLRDAILLKPLRHALESAFPRHVQSCQGRCVR